MSSSRVLFYHYTSEWGLRGIKASGYIQESSDSNNHAWYGEGTPARVHAETTTQSSLGGGTYGTSLPPWHGKYTIATNNWKRCGIFYVQKGKVDWAIEVKIPRRKIVVLRPGGRDILKHSGRIYLSDYKWRALKVPDTFDPMMGCSVPSTPTAQPTFSRSANTSNLNSSGTYMYQTHVREETGQTGDYGVKNRSSYQSTNSSWNDVMVRLAVLIAVLGIAGYFVYKNI